MSAARGQEPVVGARRQLAHDRDAVAAARTSGASPPRRATSSAQIEVNLFGVVNVTKAALPVLREQRSGHFIQFSSIGGRVSGTQATARTSRARRRPRSWPR
jgi:NAD(P)-dependent dehydrogenase (short-subunit alcohol dehydrogenase family)